MMSNEVLTQKTSLSSGEFTITADQLELKPDVKNDGMSEGGKVLEIKTKEQKKHFHFFF